MCHPSQPSCGVFGICTSLLEILWEEFQEWIPSCNPYSRSQTFCQNKVKEVVRRTGQLNPKVLPGYSSVFSISLRKHSRLIGTSFTLTESLLAYSLLCVVAEVKTASLYLPRNYTGRYFCCYYPLKRKENWGWEMLNNLSMLHSTGWGHELTFSLMKALMQ